MHAHSYFDTTWWDSSRATAGTSFRQSTREFYIDSLEESPLEVDALMSSVYDPCEKLIQDTVNLLYSTNSINFLDYLSPKLLVLDSLERIGIHEKEIVYRLLTALSNSLSPDESSDSIIAIRTYWNSQGYLGEQGYLSGWCLSIAEHSNSLWRMFDSIGVSMQSRTQTKHHSPQAPAVIGVVVAADLFGGACGFVASVLNDAINNQDTNLGAAGKKALAGAICNSVGGFSGGSGAVIPAGVGALVDIVISVFSKKP